MPDLVRRVKPKTVVADLDPKFWRSRFATWARSPSVPLENLLSAYEHKSWAAKESHPLDRIRLYREQLEFLKSQIAVRVRDAGGEWSSRAVTVRSADGLTFTTHLP